MMATVTSTNILEEIRSEPHWKVKIRPQFAEERIATPDECWRTIDRTRVTRLKLWYPAINMAGDHGQGSHWIECWRNFDNGDMNYWRFYQSGRFVNLFSFLEDRFDVQEWFQHPRWQLPDDLTGFLFFDEAVHRFTAIFEFTAHLMDAGALGHAPVVQISAKGIKGRLLTPYNPSSEWSPHYCATTEVPLEREWQITSHDDSRKQAREAARWFFKGFGYNDASDEDLKRTQDDFLNNRWSF